MSNERILSELGFYTLAGQPSSSRDLVDEVRAGEALGLGTAFISERYNKKEAATLSGAAGAVSERITIQTAATNHNTRHPMVTAGFARTMQSLTGGRFVLGLGPRHHRCCRTRTASTASRPRRSRTSSGIMRRLFRGEVIIGHDGPAGKFPVLHLDATLDEHLPMGIVAFGPNTLELGGPLLRRGRAAHVLHRRDDRSAACRPSSTPPRKPAATPSRCECGRASRPSATTFPKTSGS